ncbi:MAG TPA: hypothetical protein VKH37_05185, partial [Ferruginibacter sp.]|nr:hypothetical protein [Ferruginibacter sp.]
MSGEKNHIIYTAKDIEAYFTGKLSPEAMHAMENQSLDDAFLAEAMEGYETMQGQNLKPQLADLHKHFENLNAPARVVPISGNNRSKWWKAAAAVLLIGAGATLTIVLNNRKSDEPTQAVAKVEPTQNSSTTTPDTEKQPAPENPPVAANPNTNVSSSNSPAAPVNPSVASRTKVSTTGPEQIKQEQNAGNKLQQNKDENFVYTPPKTVVSEEKTNTQIATPNSQAINGAVENRVASPQVTNKNVAVNSSVFNSNTNINNQALSETFAKANNVDDRKKADQQANRADAPMRNFIAQVVGPDNTPLPFSNVSIKNENFGTYADVNGNF